MSYHLYKRNGVYYIYLSISGKLIRKTLKTKSRILAEKIGKQFYEIKLQQAYGATENITLKEAASRYLKSARVDSPSSVGHSEGRLQVIYKFIHPLTLLQELKPDRIEELKGFLRSEGKKGSTVNRYLSLLKVIFNQAIRDEVFSGKNPVSRVRFYTETPKQIFFNVSDLERIVQYAKGISLKAKTTSQFYFYHFIVIAIFTGMRAGEIFALTWNDIKPDHLIIRTSKSGQGRIVPISDFLFQFIQQLPKNDFFVIATKQKRTGTFAKIWNHLRSDLKIEGTIHTLRHSLGTILTQAGVDIVSVQKILGHRDIKTTQIYAHSDFNRMKSAIESLFANTKMTQDVGIKLPQIPGNVD